MFNVDEIKISELQRYVDMSKPGISKHFKSTKNGVTLSDNNRVIGLSPDAVADFLQQQTKFKFFGPSITLFANLCGGCGKTTSLSSLSAALRRITSSKDPIILIDGDSQASFTHLVCGKRAENDEKILIDYIEGNATLQDITHPVGNNIYLIKSNLNLAFLDKTLSRPSDIKRAMRDFYLDIFEKFGKNTKIFQDHTPQLSNLFASSICALYQMPDNILCNVLIPIRSDDFAIQGGKYIIDEITELQETYSFNKTKVNIHCFFSSLDRRISSSADALKKAMSDETLNNYLCPVVIRYSSEIPKSIMGGSNIFSSGKKNNVTDDYQDLLQYIFN